MAKQIIVLDTLPLPGNISQVNVVFWFPVAAGREIALPGASSVFKNASAAENGEIAAGRVVEEQFQLQSPPGTSAALVKTQLQAAYANRKAIFDAKPNPNQFYGLAWDGTTWA
jgi:hypothetical protein